MHPVNIRARPPSRPESTILGASRPLSSSPATPGPSARSHRRAASKRPGFDATTGDGIAGSHRPVLLAEAIAALRPRPNGVYLDGTFGGGGHSRALLQATAPSGRVIALDTDPAARARAAALAEVWSLGDRFTFIGANFSGLNVYRVQRGWPLLDGVLLDLGLSSFQLDDPARGFAFRFDGPLDMRFNPTKGATAADLVRDMDEASLADIIWRYGGDARNRRIASAIVRARAETPITTTGQLATIVEEAVGGRRGKRTHPATRTFQALRIVVNGELYALERGLSGAIAALKPGGRLVVIAFHSVEDRVVKQAIEAASATCVCPPEQPVCTCDVQPLLRKIGKPIQPGDNELVVNPRARSAIMRVAERTDAKLDPSAEGDG